MKKSLFRAAILGGIIVFIWGMASWMILPWHQVTLKAFTNEQRVASVIRENAPTPGVYIMPNFWAAKNQDEMTNEAKIRAETGRDRMASGPVMFASIRPTGVNPSMSGTFFLGLIFQIIAAWIITWMLMQTKGLNFWGKVRYVTLFGLFAGIVSLLPAWNWWGFSVSYVVVGMMDLIIGWFLGGIVIAKVLAKKEA